jgi:DNA-binding NarL/FixJ family response regulator
MTADYTSALIIAKPGPLRDALRSLMIAMPEIDAVAEADDLSSALRADPRHAPALVLLDSSLAHGETGLTVRQTKAEWPVARCICLVDSVQQEREAEAAGANAALLKGTPPTKLVATLIGLLSQQGKQ